MSDDARPSRVRDVYLQAVRLENKTERQAYLNEACDGNVELRQRLDRLLHARVANRTSLLHRATFHEAVAATSFGGVKDDLDEQDFTSFPVQQIFQPCQRLGRFRIRKLVGRGGMGVVYQGCDEQLDREVALKFRRIETIGNRSGQARLIREAKLAAQLDHPHLVKIYEVSDVGPAVYIAALARAVAYCHRQRILHLDIKPANIMLVSGPDDDESRRDVVPMLTDFGIARVMEESLSATESSVLIGTPLYMAPEQANCKREAIGPASDVYSLGVILHELLFGQRPYEGESTMMVLDRVRADDTIRLPDAPAVPTDLKTICQRCLEHSHRSRYPTADALAEDLERYLRGEVIHARPIRWWHRFGRWCQQPERVFQAGLLSVPIQAALLMNFAGVVIGLYRGVFEVSVDPHSTAMDISTVAFGAHVPLMILALLTFCRIRWSVFPGLLLSLLTVGVLGEILINGDSPIKFYDDYPAARYLMHLLILVIMTIQTMAYLFAIPAALGKRTRSPWSVDR